MRIKWFKSVEDLKHYFSKSMRRQRFELSLLQFYLHCFQMGYRALDKGENNIMPLGETSKEFAESCFELGRRHMQLFDML